MVKQHYKELYDSIKIMRAHTNEKTSFMLTKIECLKAQLKSKVSCIISDSVKPKVLAPGMYVIDVEPIHPRLKNNKSAHLNYINHLKESVETVREIVEEARVVKPLDNALNYACQYTKLSQELLEYVIVSSSTDASRSKPRSNTKKNRILPAKSKNKMKVEDHPRTNKSVWTKVNRVESSISSKRVVINSNSESVFGKLSTNGLNKAKQVWKATSKVFANVGYQWRPTGKKFILGKHIGGHQWRPTGKMFLLGEQCPLTRLSMKCRKDRPLVSGLRLFKTYDGESFKVQELRRKVHRDSQIRE
ncbi:hypothetical protein Tco_1559509 [Tanacetum coccineum]